MILNLTVSPSSRPSPPAEPEDWECPSGTFPGTRKQLTFSTLCSTAATCNEQLFSTFLLPTAQQTLSQTRAFLPKAQQQSNYDNCFSLSSQKTNFLKVICAVNTTAIQESGAGHEYTPTHLKGAKMKRITAWISFTFCSHSSTSSKNTHQY